jgi:hypothetical protein
MRYKVVKKTYISNDKPVSKYYVMYEKKVWWKKEPVWRYCREHTYTSYDSWRGEPVKRNNLVEAEDYIKIQMRIDNDEFEPEDIKIYECRDTKLDKILK